jgi:hypothetical protein
VSHIGSDCRSRSLLDTGAREVAARVRKRRQSDHVITSLYVALHSMVPALRQVGHGDRHPPNALRRNC